MSKLDFHQLDARCMSTSAEQEHTLLQLMIAHNLVFTMEILSNASRVLAERCVDGITADAQQCAYWLERSPAIVTALAPKIGYSEAAKLAKEAVERNLTVRELVVEKGVLSAAEVDDMLNLEAMTELGVPGTRKD